MSTENQAEKKDNNTGMKPNGLKPNDKKPKFNITWIYGIIAITLFGIMILSPMGGQPKEVTWSDFEQKMLKNHDVLKIEVINRERAEIFIKPEKMTEARYADAAKSKNKTFSGNSAQYFFTIGFGVFTILLTGYIYNTYKCITVIMSAFLHPFFLSAFWTIFSYVPLTIYI